MQTFPVLSDLALTSPADYHSCGPGPLSACNERQAIRLIKQSNEAIAQHVLEQVHQPIPPHES